MKYYNHKISPVVYDDINLDVAVKKIIKSNSIFVVTPNIDHIMRLWLSKSLLDIYKSANLILNDSKVFQIVSYLLLKPIKYVVRGSDLTKELLDIIKGKKILVFGNIINKQRLKTYYPKNQFYQIQATFNKKNPINDINKINKFLNINSVDYIFLCGGFPYSEIIANGIIKKFKNEKIICIGSGINFAVGLTKRAPKFISKIGLEWFFRMITEPRLIKRYLINLKYFYLMLFK